MREISRSLKVGDAKVSPFARKNTEHRTKDLRKTSYKSEINSFKAPALPGKRTICKAYMDYEYELFLNQDSKM